MPVGARGVAREDLGRDAGYRGHRRDAEPADLLRVRRVGDVDEARALLVVAERDDVALDREPVRGAVAGRAGRIDELAGLADPEKNAIGRLGIVGIDVDDDTEALLPGLRISSGVFVAARTEVSSVITAYGPAIRYSSPSYRTEPASVRVVPLRIVAPGARRPAQRWSSVERTARDSHATHNSGALVRAAIDGSHSKGRGGIDVETKR